LKYQINSYNFLVVDTNIPTASWATRTDEVRRAFESRGLSIAAWARTHGYSCQLVYQILKRQKPCLRGQSHEIAVRLGLKSGVIGSVDDFDLSAPSPMKLPERSGVDAPCEEAKP
jgi:gp16 family phage-associated protein